jgi:hypothetical protein
MRNFSFRVMFMWDTGLIERWDNKMAPKPKACLDIKQRPTNNVRLDLRNLSGAFAILTVGLCFSCVVFLCELMLRFLLNRMKNH